MMVGAGFLFTGSKQTSFWFKVAKYSVAKFVLSIDNWTLKIPMDLLRHWAN